MLQAHCMHLLLPGCSPQLVGLVLQQIALHGLRTCEFVNSPAQGNEFALQLTDRRVQRSVPFPQIVAFESARALCGQFAVETLRPPATPG
jgi:hypothetical protein